MTSLEIYKHFKTVLPAEQFIITGSNALYLMGVTKSTPGDIDVLLVNPSDEAISLCEKLNLLDFLKSDKSDAYRNSSLLAQFEFDGKKIDIFRTNKKRDELLSIDGVYVDKLDLIIAAKKSYNRPKDWIHCAKIAQVICTQSELNQYISKSSL